MWLGIRFLTNMYGENLIEREESILYAPQIHRRRLIIV
jgi:hypothetical protein